MSAYSRISLPSHRPQKKEKNIRKCYRKTKLIRKSPKTQENTRVLKDKLIFFRIITAFLLILLISFPKITLANTDAEIAFWNSVEKMDTYAGYTAYLEQYPNGKFSKLAAIKIKSALSSETEKVTPRTKPASAADPAA